MSYVIDSYHLNKLPGQSLAVIQCGLQICHPGHSCGPHTYHTYSAHFIIEGKGTYIVDGRSYELSAGQGFMIMPEVSNTYTADKKDPWKYIYASFIGADDDVLVHNAGLNESNSTFTFPLDDTMLNDLHAMHTASKSYDALGYDVTAYFLLVMSRLIRANTQNKNKAVCPMHYVNKAIFYVENNYDKSITIKDITSFVKIDRTYLYKLFRKYLGESPTMWLNNYRLNKAVEMMENEDISINEIAYSTGFYDVSHFYKAFSKKFKCSPKTYRDEYYKRRKYK